MRLFRRLAVSVTAVALLLVGVGGLVRATGSGLGCLDEWPKCRGGWTAPGDLEGVIEYSHRALAAVVIVLIVALAVTAYRKRDEVPAVLRRWAYVMPVPWVLQALVGARVVFRDLHAATVTVHLAAAMFLVFASVRVTAGTYVSQRARAANRGAARMSVGAVVATALVLLAGAYVREKGAGLAFKDWPLMDGTLVPSFDAHGTALQFVHRFLAAAAFLHLCVTYIRVRTDGRRPVRTLAAIALGLYVVQSVIGGLNVLTSLSVAAVLAHVAGAALTWAAVCGLAVVSRREGPVTERSKGVVKAYVQLTKPQIIRLLLVTTVPAMIVAERGFPSLWLIGATLIGGTFAAGGANAINQYLDRDIDQKMHRTRKRPLPSHRVEPGRALVFGGLLGVIGFVWLSVTVNVLSGVLATAALLFYVFVYTLGLKRRTPQNIVIGGAAGAVPVLVGWAAVTGRLDPAAWVLFAIIFVWTPPHFWALSMRYAEDYKAAGVPMMPVVKGVQETTKQIVWYTVVTVLVTLALIPTARMGLIYVGAALLLGGLFLVKATQLRRTPSPEQGMHLFKYSIQYLGLLFAAMAVDKLVPL